MRTTLVTLLAAGLLAGCGEATAPPDEPAPEAVVAPVATTSDGDDVPAAFPLDTGLQVGPDEHRIGPGADVEGVSLSALCDSTAWPGGGTDRLAVRVEGAEDSTVRELVTYRGVAKAAAVLEAVRADPAACEPVEAEVGYDAVTLGRQTDGAVVVVQLVRVGRAVMATQKSAATVADLARELTDANRQLLPELCVFTADGCPAPTASDALEGFPLDLGYRDRNEDGSRVEVTDRPGVDRFDLCGEPAWDPYADTLDLVGVEFEAPEFFRGRTLVLYDSEDAAAAALQRARAAVAGCLQQRDEDGYGTDRTLLDDVRLGDESLVWIDRFYTPETDSHDTGLVVHFFVRVGSALLASYEYGEGNGSDASRASAIEWATDATRPVVAAMAALG